MPSKKKKGHDPSDYQLEALGLQYISETAPALQRYKWQIPACLDGPTPRAIPAHAHELKSQLDKVYRASRGREGVPRKLIKHFSESFDELYDKLLPGTAGISLFCVNTFGLFADDTGDPIAAAVVHEKREAQDDDSKRARRIDAFRAELPRPFNQRRDVDPSLAIFMPMDDGGVVAVLRDLTADRILDKIREAMHEAHWWFMEDGFVGWVIAVTQLPGGDLEVFPDTKEHRDVLQEYPAWETIFLERLKLDSRRYGVSPVDLGILHVPTHQEEGRKALLTQQLFDWNKRRIQRLKRIEDILSVEVRPTNYGTPIAIVNLATPELANEFIKRGIKWGEERYRGRKYIQEWSLFQCEQCWSFGHTSVSCTQGVKCRQCALSHPENRCKSAELQCVNCGGYHTSTDKSCPQRENEARCRREIPACAPKYWPIDEAEVKLTNRDAGKSSLGATSPPSRGDQAEAKMTSQKEGVNEGDQLEGPDQHTTQVHPKLSLTDSADLEKRHVEPRPALGKSIEKNKTEMKQSEVASQTEAEETQSKEPQSSILSQIRQRNITHLLQKSHLASSTDDHQHDSDGHDQLGARSTSLPPLVRRFQSRVVVGQE
ncbi:MAG: hypothetical protein Q9169_004280 [Polycauliona sp. 2 TL-2023]